MLYPCQRFARLLGIFAALAVAPMAQSFALEPNTVPIRIGLSGAPKTLNPALAADAAGARILQLTHPSLLRWGPDYTPLGNIATGCTQPLPIRVECSLPNGQRYSNGTPLTAARVAAWFALLQSTPRSPLAGALKGVSIAVPSPQVVAFTLPSPTTTFFSTLVETPLADPSATSAGLGDYTAVQDEATGIVSLTPRKPTLPALQFVPLSDPSTRLLKLQKGELDVLVNDLPPTLVRYAQANAAKQGWQLLTAPSSAYSYVVLNFRNPLLAQPGVREALSLALDRPLMRKALLANLADPADSLLPIGHAARYTVSEDVHDPLSAEALLEDTQLPDGRTLLLGPDGTRLSLTLLTSTEPFSQRVGQALQAQWAEVGIEVKLQSAEWATFHSRVQQGQFDMAFLTWTGEQQPSFYYQLFNASQTPPNGFNRGGVDEPELNHLTSQLMAATSTSATISLAKQVQQQVAQVRPYLPLWRRHHVLIMGKGIAGCTIPLSGAYTGLTGCVRN